MPTEEEASNSVLRTSSESSMTASSYCSAPASVTMRYNSARPDGFVDAEEELDVQNLYSLMVGQDGTGSTTPPVEGVKNYRNDFARLPPMDVASFDRLAQTFDNDCDENLKNLVLQGGGGKLSLKPFACQRS